MIKRNLTATHPLGGHDAGFFSFIFFLLLPLTIGVLITYLSIDLFNV
jgi:hypothetical protein